MFSIDRLESLDSIFRRLDAAGGWPAGKNYMIRMHGTEPFECEFSNVYAHTEWWSTVCSIDDYFWWKISDSWKDKLKHQIRVTCQTTIKIPEIVSWRR